MGEVDPLIVLVIDGNRAVAIRRGKHRETASGNALGELHRQCESHPEAWICWLDHRFEERIDVDSWSRRPRHRLDLRHLGSADDDPATASLGYVDFDSPFLLAVPDDRPATSPLVSPLAGIAQAKLLTRVLPTDAPGASGGALRRWLSGTSGGGHADRRSGARTGLGQDHLEIRTALVSCSLGGSNALGFPLAPGLESGDRPRSASASSGDSFGPDRSTPTDPGPGPRRSARIGATGRGGRRCDHSDPQTPGSARGCPGRPRPADGPARRVFVIDQDPDRAVPEQWRRETTEAGIEVERLSTRKVGACRARNLGLERAGLGTADRPQWILFLDDDVRLPRDFVASLLANAEAYGCEAVQALAYLPTENPESLRPAPHPILWPRLGTGASVVSGAAAARAGGFDLRLEGGYGEDYDYRIRLRRGGVEVLLDPRIEVLHLKAPAGGFRRVHRHPWHGAPGASPRPSPTVQLSRALHHTAEMQRGFALFYALQRLRSTSPGRWPVEIPKAIREWRSSIRWSRYLEGTGA